MTPSSLAPDKMLKASSQMMKYHELSIFVGASTVVGFSIFECFLPKPSEKRPCEQCRWQAILGEEVFFCCLIFCRWISLGIQIASQKEFNLLKTPQTTFLEFGSLGYLDFFSPFSFFWCFSFSFLQFFAIFLCDVFLSECFLPGR